MKRIKCRWRLKPRSMANTQQIIDLVYLVSQKIYSLSSLFKGRITRKLTKGNFIEPCLLSMSLFFKQSRISETLIYNKITSSLYIFEVTKTMYLDPKHLRS